MVDVDGHIFTRSFFDSKTTRFLSIGHRKVIINGKMDAANYSAYSGYAHLGAGGSLTAMLIRTIQKFRFISPPCW